jgi:hypothetical protein
MRLETILTNVEELAKIPYAEGNSGQRFMNAAMEIQKAIESHGQMAVDAVAEMLDHPDPDVNIAAIFVLGQEWAIAHYEKMMELSRRHPDHVSYQRIVLTPIIAVLHATGAPAASAFLDEFADISEDHASLLVREVTQFAAYVEQLRALRNMQDGTVQ